LIISIGLHANRRLISLPEEMTNVVFSGFILFSMNDSK
jgi:hypothetical protein